MANTATNTDAAVGDLLLYMLENKGSIFTGLNGTAARATKDSKGLELFVKQIADGKTSSKNLAFYASKLSEVLSRQCEATANMALLLSIYLNGHTFDQDACDLAAVHGKGDEAKALVVKARFANILGSVPVTEQAVKPEDTKTEVVETAPPPSTSEPLSVAKESL
jgi:hypothetical protein